MAALAELRGGARVAVAGVVALVSRQHTIFTKAGEHVDKAEVCLVDHSTSAETSDRRLFCVTLWRRAAVWVNRLAVGDAVCISHCSVHDFRGQLRANTCAKSSLRLIARPPGYHTAVMPTPPVAKLLEWARSQHPSKCPGSALMQVQSDVRACSLGALVDEAVVHIRAVVKDAKWVRDRDGNHPRIVAQLADSPVGTTALILQGSFASKPRFDSLRCCQGTQMALHVMYVRASLHVADGSFVLYPTRHFRMLCLPARSDVACAVHARVSGRVVGSTGGVGTLLPVPVCFSELKHQEAGALVRLVECVLVVNHDKHDLTTLVRSRCRGCGVVGDLQTCTCAVAKPESIFAPLPCELHSIAPAAGEGRKRSRDDYIAVVVPGEVVSVILNGAEAQVRWLQRYRCICDSHRCFAVSDGSSRYSASDVTQPDPCYGRSSGAGQRLSIRRQIVCRVQSANRQLATSWLGQMVWPGACVGENLLHLHLVEPPKV